MPPRDPYEKPAGATNTGGLENMSLSQGTTRLLADSSGENNGAHVRAVRADALPNIEDHPLVAGLVQRSYSRADAVTAVIANCMDSRT